MKISKFLLPALFAASLSAAAVELPVNPVPQQVTIISENGINTTEATFKLTAAGNVDADALRSLRENIDITPNGSVNITLGMTSDAAFAQYADKVPTEEGAYYLEVNAPDITIVAREANGAFYGVQSLIQLTEMPVIPNLEIADKPAGAIRGIIEGFYGHPWSHENRLDMFRFMGRHKMNEYVYGPKNDPYHRSQWATPYPEEEAAQMKELIDEAHSNKVHFVWAMHPGTATDTTKYEAAVAKLEAMYTLGVRSFAIFCDDVGGQAEQQVAYLEALDSLFVKKHTDVSPLVFCPSAYNNAFGGNANYFAPFKASEMELNIMWTGRSVVDMLVVDNMTAFRDWSGRKPYIWLNYPVNDYGGGSLLMGEVIRLDKNILPLVSAFCSNPMEYAQASKVGLYQLADFAWNPESFNPTTSWEGAIRELAPGAEQEFRLFCESHKNYYSSSHGYSRDDETPNFKTLKAENPILDITTEAAYRAYFERQVAAGQKLQALADSSALFAEINLWTLNYQLQGERGVLLCDMTKDLDAKEYDKFIEHYTAYREKTEQAAALSDRGWLDIPGVTKSFTPRSATTYVEPFVAKTASDLGLEFKLTGQSYPAGLFAEQIVPDGLYYIMYNGKYLSNGSGTAANSPSYPTLRADADNVNPNRQVWTIRKDAQSGRYSITSAHDDRYVNEKGEFGVNDYSAAWNTYNFSSLNGKFAIQNGGSGGSNYWTVKGTRLEKGSNDSYNPSNFKFELVPVTGEPFSFSGITLPATVVIVNDKGQALTRRTSDDYPAFTTLGDTPKTTQKFKIELDKTTNEFSIRSASGNRPLDQTIKFRTTGDYDALWHTYQITEHNGKFAIRNHVTAEKQNNTNWWIMNEDRSGLTTMGNYDEVEAHQFIFLNAEESAIEEIEASAASEAIYDLQGRRVVAPTHGLYIINGQKTIIR